MSPAEQARATMRAIGRFLAFWFYLCPVRAFGLALNHLLSLLLGGIVISASLYISLPVLASWVGKEQALQEADYIKHGVVALGLAAVVLLMFFVIVAPASMYWEQKDKAEKFDPGPQKRLLHDLLRWVSDRASEINNGDPISMVILYNHTLALIEAGFGRSHATKCGRRWYRSQINRVDVSTSHVTDPIRTNLVRVADVLADSLVDMSKVQHGFNVADWVTFRQGVESATMSLIRMRGLSIRGSREDRANDPLFGLNKKRKEVMWWTPIVVEHLRRTGQFMVADEVEACLANCVPKNCGSIEQLQSLTDEVMTLIDDCLGD